MPINPLDGQGPCDRGPGNGGQACQFSKRFNTLTAAYLSLSATALTQKKALPVIYLTSPSQPDTGMGEAALTWSRSDETSYAPDRSGFERWCDA